MEQMVYEEIFDYLILKCYNGKRKVENSIMNTKIIKIEVNNYSEEDLEEAADILQNGGLVAFPTETVYGLGADALDADASGRIYEAKGRPSDNPLIIHICNINDLKFLVRKVPKKAEILAEKFWPGPLTMIFEKSESVPYETTGGLETVAVRMPVNRIALDLIKKSGVFIAAPSANTSGRPSPTKASHVITDLSGKINMIIDGGSVGIGLESTILDMTSDIPVILRPGYITRSMLEKAVGRVDIDKAVVSRKIDEGLMPKAPGMKYKHYAPKGNLTICEGDLDKVSDYINKIAEEKINQGYKVGIIATDESVNKYRYGVVKTIGTRKNEDTIAKRLYSLLREFDDLEIDYIYTESFEDDALGQAIMNRLIKAAGYQLVSV